MDYSAIAAELRSAVPGLEIRENEPMSEHCSFRIGGPAALMLLPGSAAGAAQTMRILRAAGAATLIMGNGTNLLVSDAGYDGAVVCMSKPMGALELADAIAANAQVAVRQSKAAIRRGLQTDMATGAAYESEAFALCFATEDQKDAMRAFLNKEKLDGFKNR